MKRINITNTSFSDRLPPSELHWLIADEHEAITVESLKEGLFVYDNPVGVLANNPTFPWHMVNLNNYMGLTSSGPSNSFAPGLELRPFSRGMGAVGLPGDLSSVSRFVRAAFVKLNSVCDGSESQSVSQFFHIRGACLLYTSRCV